jgi:hypothetical protein
LADPSAKSDRTGKRRTCEVTLDLIGSLPLGAVFLMTALLVVVTSEAGYLLGRARHRHSEEEKESPVSAIAASILGLLAFILAFTFGIVTERFQNRTELVTEEANAIGTAYLRADVLPDPERERSRELFRSYVTLRVQSVKSGDRARVKASLSEAEEIQRQLWEMAISDAKKESHSDIAFLYVESLNEVFDMHFRRVTLGMETRIPAGIWVVLIILVVLGMLATGYQLGIAASGRSLSTPVLAIAFALVIALIVEMDQPRSTLLPVSQRPLEILLASMGVEPPSPSGPSVMP